LVFIDETASDSRTGFRKYSWSLASHPTDTKTPTRRSERYSICPAFDINGYLPSALIKQGGVTKEEFVDWIEAEVLIRIVRGSILIMDNASIYYSKRLTELVINAGCFLEYLLPYSPDFNPIEQLFNVLKSWIKRHR
jgi:hypothetical protein